MLVWQRVGTAGLAAGVCAVLLAACSVKESSGKPDRGVGSLAKRQELLGAFADCALSEVQWFQQSAAALREAAMTHEATLSADSLTALRGAWESAEDRWQVLELFQFGPAAKSNMPGGQDLRDQIYVWPLFNRCLIEQIIVNKAFQPELFSRQPANARGLGGLEYVAFYAADDNACPTTNPINVNGTWQALVADGLGAAKAGFARAAAEDLRKYADTLAVAWDPAQGGFRDQLADAGADSTVYTTTQAGLNAVSDALFYLDVVAKDVKLARPLGLMDCATSTCPELVEAPFAGRSIQNVRRNLFGFRKLFSGCNDGQGLGFDDLLADVGQAAVADRIAKAVEAALAAVDAIEEPTLELALAQDIDSVRALHTALKAITDLLKTDFTTILDLGLPVGAEGDND